MTREQGMIITLLVVVLINFIWGKLRFDFVALSSLIIATLLGLVAPGEAFDGFANSAVITVAAILVLSEGLVRSGFVDATVQTLEKKVKRPRMQFLFLVFGVAAFSAFMNNVGAMALFMPVAIKTARKTGVSPSRYLMPMAFASLLGGLITLVGSPPNIIVSQFREDLIGRGFGMFEFAPVGLSLTLLILPIMLFAAPQLTPVRKENVSQEDLFEIKDYTTSVKLIEGCELIGKSLVELGRDFFADVNVIGYVRNERKHSRVSPYMDFRVNDMLILEASTDNIEAFLKKSKLTLSGSKKLSAEEIGGNGVIVSEVVVTQTSHFVGKTARDMDLRNNHGVNLLGVARVGVRVAQSPNRIPLKEGDVLLLQGTSGSIQEAIRYLGVLPLVDRGIELKSTTKIALSLSIFIGALLIVAFEILPATIAFTTAALIMILTDVISIKRAYEAIDFPILILLGSLIPVSQALETTGAAGLISSLIIKIAPGVEPWAILAILLFFSMALTNLINNAAAALLMAPIAIGVAQLLGLNPDAFLMIVLVGSTSAYMTPIGHQSNTIIMGPGGYHFGDYWRLGLLVSVMTFFISIPVIMYLWPV
ncbi:MAG: SLC13 family permease [Tissierellia bacterium]|nr:SLC13 family permease [Tissierellia bacterium]